MTAKKTQQKKRKQIQNPPKKKNTPFADAGTIIGHRAGQILGYPMLKGVGKWLGEGIGSIFGSGDYQMMGAHPKYNVLMSDAQIPKFSSSRQTNIVCHREYLKDVTGTTNFVLQSFPLNPGLAFTFPWLATVAEAYQEYRFHGLIFEFRPLITDFITAGAPGVVIMATNYNADAPMFGSKQAMENSEYAVATKPTLALIHGVECDPSQTILPERYTRTGVVPAGQDLRLYDLGNMQIATQGNPNGQLIGELWVSYCVEFFKPILPASVTDAAASGRVQRSIAGNSAPFGNVAVSNSGTLALTVSAFLISWVGFPGTTYSITLEWIGGAGVSITAPNLAFTGLSAANLNVTNNPGFQAPNDTGTSSNFIMQLYYTCNTVNSSTVTIIPTGGGLPASSSFQVLVTAVDGLL